MLELCLGVEDVDLLDAVLCLVPLLRVVTVLGQEARRRGLKYPIATPQELASFAARDTFELSGHRVDRKTIVSAMPAEWFPIWHEGELLSAIHLALHRCQAEAAPGRLSALLLGKVGEDASRSK